ncbi:murein hydrolase activator EnvC family protein [Risungbinella massiliensis]|uniref:murein hydrolase activator EnvC family protein n=1 Tax=Risungbinella massiliensis TaxID=1329796 RepID=UPI0005CC02BB|nr:peptidoglycan DD-metalloendopeptidase family protein [Risungbinella massiliensis]
MRKYFITLTLTAALVATPMVTKPVYALTKEEQKLKDIQKQEKEKKSELEKLQPNFTKSKAELMEIDKKVRERQESIDRMNVGIVQKEEELKKKKEVMNGKLVDIYTNGSVGYLRYLMDAKDFQDFFNKLDYVRLNVLTDNYAVKEVLKTKQTLESDRAVQQKEIDEMKPLLTDAQNKHKAMEAEYNKVKADLEKLEDQEEATEESIRKSKEDLLAAGNHRGDYKASGQFMWPTSGGSISSPYGYRNGRMHEGIDIAGSGILGKPIYASDSGVISLIKSDPNGYGMYIIISHGNGFSSLYAHMYSSTIRVKTGQKVSKGQVIASVGNNGRSSGPHLHFEIMKNGTNVNPAHYVRR